LKLKYDKLLSNFGFNLNLRHYNKDAGGNWRSAAVGAVQVHPGLEAVDPTLAFRDFQRLKLQRDEPLSIVAFKMQSEGTKPWCTPTARSSPWGNSCTFTLAFTLDAPRGAFNA